MTTRGCRRAALALIGLLWFVPVTNAQPRVDLGTIAIPQDFDDRTSVLPKGDYGLVLRGEELALIQKNWRDGLERSFGIATRAEDAAILDAAYGELQAYIQSNTSERMARELVSAQETGDRCYIYGAYQAMVLDRVFPDWKAGVFENDRTLDDVLVERLALTASDRDAAAARFARVYQIDEVRARHAAVFKARQDAIASVRSRQGRAFRVDVRQAQRNVDIRPRPGAIITPAEQVYPHGLDGLTYGSLRLVSMDTPMTLRGPLLEWVDTEPVSGEKGYDVKYDVQDGELFRNVTATTKGFTFTAKAIRVMDDGKVVTFFVVD